MSLADYRELFVIYSSWLAWITINFLYTSIRNISWILNGTYWRLLQNQKPENYEECAHVMSILCKHHVDQFIEPRLSDYMLAHERFENPEYLLRDDVTLLTITASEAIFVKARKGARPPYLHNFIILGQWAAVERVITIPMNQFHRLAEGMKRDGGKIIFLQNQSRCGGTLLTNVFLETGRCITFNEPGLINALCKYVYIQPSWSDEEARRVFSNSIRMLCKPYRGLKDTPLAYIIKPTVTAIPSTDIIQKYVPEAIQIFLYREPVHVAISLRRLGQVLPTLKLMYFIPNIPKIVSHLLAFIGHTEVDFRGWTPRVTKELEVGYRTACLSMRYYLTYRDQGVNITGIKYEDLITSRDSIVRKMFDVCKLPADLVDDALKALDKDSQAECAFSRDKLKKAIPNPPKVTTAFLEAARDMAKEFNVKGPDCWESFYRLPGSIEP